MDMTSLAMLILDDVYYTNGRTSLHNVLGGAGTYAALGARLFRPVKLETKSAPVGFVLHAGYDFPQSNRNEIESWQTRTQIIDTWDRPTTRGKNVYTDEVREFEFLTPKLQVNHTMLSKDMLMSKTFHLICTSDRCIELVKTVLHSRQSLHETQENAKSRRFDEPLFVWEPMEGSCKPSERPALLEALQYVDVFSPNHEELASLFEDQIRLQIGLPCSEIIRRQCNQLLDQGFKGKPGAVIIRQGEDGCFIAQKTCYAQIPAYHAPPNDSELEQRAFKESKVVDVTGGGNAFLGGFCIGLIDYDEHLNRPLSKFEYAAAYGTVAASFAIEQVGMPKLSPCGADGDELWNGERVTDRLKKLLSRLR